MMRDIEAEAAEEKRAVSVGTFILQLTQGGGLGGLAGGVLKGFSVRMPTEEDPAVLLIVKAGSDKGPRVAFVGAYRLGDALLAWRARDRKGRMKWREDKPWSGGA